MRLNILHQNVFRIVAFAAPLFHWRQAGRKTYIQSFGESARLKLRTNIYDHWAAHEVWEREEYLDDQMPIHPTDIVVDIGAHIGAFAIWAARRASQGRVYAFEPNCENHSLLVENIQLNQLTNLEAFQAAVSDREGEVSFFNSRHSSMSHSFFEPGEDERSKVPAVSLGGILESKGIERVNYLKVDAEGAEYLIILGAPPEVLKKVDRIFVEFHDYFEHGHNFRELETRLSDHGFHVTMGRNFWLRLFFKIGYIKAVRILAE